MRPEPPNGAMGLLSILYRRISPLSMVVISLTSCAEGDTHKPVSWLLEDGSAIEDQLQDSVFTAVLVLPSKMCFGCNPAIREWRTLEDTTELRVRLILDQQPAAGDSRLLRVQRISVNGILRKPSRLSTILHLSRRDPVELLFYGDSLIASSARDVAATGTSFSPVLREARRLIGEHSHRRGITSDPRGKGMS